MDRITLASLNQLVFETKSVEFREKNTVSQFGGFDDYGTALLAAGDVEITFLWRTKSVEGMNTHSAIYQIEIDHSTPTPAQINRTLVDRKAKKLDKYATSAFLVSLIKSHIGWLIEVDKILSEPRLNLVSSVTVPDNNPYPNLVRF